MVLIKFKDFLPLSSSDFFYIFINKDQNQQHTLFLDGFPFPVTVTPPGIVPPVDFPLRTISPTVLNRSSTFLPSLALTSFRTAPREEAYSLTTEY